MAQQKKVQAPGIDLLEDAKSFAKPEELAAIIGLARAMYRLELDIVALQQTINSKIASFNALQMQTLPERMVAAQLKSFELENGYIVEVKDFIKGTIPSESQIEEERDSLLKQALVLRRTQALVWLRKNGGAALLKNKLTAEFGKGEEKAAKEFEKQIGKQGYKVKRDENVNFQTLNSFIREKLKEGVEVPVEPFALFNGHKAEIKLKKEKASWSPTPPSK